MDTIHLTLKPHLERGGYHIDKFDVLLDGEIICTGKSGWHKPARALLAKGYPPDTLLHVQHAGTTFDPTIVPQAIGELAKWTIDETGICKVRWKPYPGKEPSWWHNRQETAPQETFR